MRTCKGPDFARQAVSPAFLALVGRDLVRRGQSLHVIRVGADGRVRLAPAADWHFEGGTDDPDSWICRATTYGPTASITRTLPSSGVVFVTWAVTAGTPYAGTGPLSWASTTARLAAQSERSISDEVSGPVAQILPVPSDGGDGGGDDPLAQLKLDITGAKGRAVLTETTAAGWGEGRQAAPQSDWKPQRLGPAPTEAQARIARDSFERVLAACGYPPSLAIDSDGTSQREGLRRWHLSTVVPLARILEDELSRKLETEVRLKFDSYPLDMVSRAQVVSKLVQAGVALDTATMAVGLD